MYFQQLRAQSQHNIALMHCKPQVMTLVIRALIVTYWTQELLDIWNYLRWGIDTKDTSMTVQHPVIQVISDDRKHYNERQHFTLTKELRSIHIQNSVYNLENLSQ
jgi:hypothetical protein